MILICAYSKLLCSSNNIISYPTVIGYHIDFDRIQSSDTEHLESEK
jgi:hypothetical protein